MSSDARRPVRHLDPPRSLRERAWRLRYLIARRACQTLILVAFIGTAHFGWKVAGQPLLAGNLSAASVVGVVPIADPFAVAQLLAAGRDLAVPVLVGTLVALAFYGLVAGRAFCSWVCPMNIVTETAAWVRSRLGVADLVHVDPRARYVVMLLALVLSAAGGLAAFDFLSPVAALHRELIYGIGLGLAGAAGIFLLDAFVLRHGWCGHLCPLGAFHALAGRAARLRVHFDADACTRCGDCVKACPEPRVINLVQAAERGRVAPGECTQCGRCIAVCPEDALAFGLRAAPPRAASASASIPGESR